MSNKTTGRKKAAGEQAVESETTVPEQVSRISAQDHSQDGQAKDQAKAAKEIRKQAKDEAKSVAKDHAQAAKATRQLAKDEAKLHEKGESGHLTPGTAKKFVGVAKILGPVLAPYAARAAAAAREGYERARAYQLGVPVDDLGRFTGKGAALHARIAGDAQALRDLRSRTGERPDQDQVTVEQFAEAAETRLGDLTSAVRAAERMPVARRRSVHQATASELDRIENDLLRRFGL